MAVQELESKDLKQIALDLYAGKIFCDRHCTNDNEIRMVFMPLSLMKPEQVQELADKKVAFIYEYIDKAGPRSVNGMPMFMSFRVLTEDQFNRMSKFHEAIINAVDEVQVEDEVEDDDVA